MEIVAAVAVVAAVDDVFPMPFDDPLQPLRMVEHLSSLVRYDSVVVVVAAAVAVAVAVVVAVVVVVVVAEAAFAVRFVSRGTSSRRLVSRVPLFLAIVSWSIQWCIAPFDCLVSRSDPHVHVSHPQYFAPRAIFQTVTALTCTLLVIVRLPHESICSPLPVE